MALFYKAVKSTMATKAGDKKWHLNLVKVAGWYLLSNWLK